MLSPSHVAYPWLVTGYFGTSLSNCSNTCMSNQSTSTTCCDPGSAALTNHAPSLSNPRQLLAEIPVLQLSQTMLLVSRRQHDLSETMSVKLHGRSHQARKPCKDGLPYGSRALWVSRVEGVQGCLVRSIPKKFLNVKGFKCSKVRGLQGAKE